MERGVVLSGLESAALVVAVPFLALAISGVIILLTLPPLWVLRGLEAGLSERLFGVWMIILWVTTLLDEPSVADAASGMFPATVFLFLALQRERDVRRADAAWRAVDLGAPTVPGPWSQVVGLPLMPETFDHLDVVEAEGVLGDVAEVRRFEGRWGTDRAWLVGRDATGRVTWKARAFVAPAMDRALLVRRRPIPAAARPPDPRPSASPAPSRVEVGAPA